MIGPGNIIRIPLTTPPTVVPPATVTGANNLLSIEPAGTNVQFGEDLAAPTGLSVLIHDTLAPLDQFVLKMSEQLNGQFTNLFFNDTPSAIVLENDTLNSPVKSTEVSYKLRINPDNNPPFDQSFETFLGLRNTGESFIRARDLQTVPVGTNAITFEMQDFVNGVVEVGRFNSFGLFGVGTGAAIAARIHSKFDANAQVPVLALDNSNGGANAVVSASWFNGFGQTFVNLNSNTAAVDKNLFQIDNSQTAGDIELKTLNGGLGLLRVVNGVGVTVNGGTGFGSVLDVNGAITTDDPGGGTAEWLLGTRKAAAVVFDATHYVEVKIGGTVVRLGVVT